MNNGYRWLSDNEVEILRDDDKVRGKVDGNINVEKILLYQNIIEILGKRMFDLEENMVRYVGSCIFNAVLILVNLIVMLASIVLGLIFSNVSFFPILTKITFGVLICFGGESIISISQLNKLKKEYNASDEIRKMYEKGLEESINIEKELTNSFYKPTNVVSFSEYNTMFYELVDKQVNDTMEKNEVKKRTLKKKR